MRRLIVLVLVALAVAGLAVHFTVRDSIAVLAPLFYAVPLPVAGAGLVVAALFARRPLRRISFLAGVLTLGGWFFTDFGFARPEKGGSKFATWNLQNTRHPSQALVKFVRAEWPDFMALLEVGTLTPDAVRFYERSLPAYRLVSLGGDRAFLVRGAGATSIATQMLDTRTHVATIRLHLRGEWIRVIVVDLDSAIFRPRRPALKRITAMAAGSRTIVLGDFNTPLQSAHLDGLRKNFAAATEGPHAGFRETWPYGAPLLSLDQIWLSRDFEPRFARCIPTLASDHSPVVAIFRPR